MNSPNPLLQLVPIGFIRTRMVNKFQTPHQPDNTIGSSSIVELLEKKDLHKAVDDLSGFEYIWLIWWFHKNRTWRPKVRPPRGEGNKRGVFATRSPHRPNPIGISAVKLLHVDGLKLTIGDCDLVDGTPILDIKPYIPSVDSFPKAQVGWLAEVQEFYEQETTYLINFLPQAIEQKKWLEDRGVNFLERAIKILERDPSINRTRRINKFGNIFRIGCAEWRIFFDVTDKLVEIKYFRPGYRLEKLNSPGAEVIANRDLQLEFYDKWSGE